jgi:hypothetical protein
VEFGVPVRRGRKSTRRGRNEALRREACLHAQRMKGVSVSQEKGVYRFGVCRAWDCNRSRLMIRNRDRASSMASRSAGPSVECERS